MHWKESYDWKKHKNRMGGKGAQPDRHHDEALDPHTVYFVRTCGFKFEFHSLAQLQVCLDYFSRKVHPSSRIKKRKLVEYCGDHSEAQRWFERLPMKLMDNHRRPRVVAALKSAQEDFNKKSTRKTRGTGRKRS